MCKQDHTFTHRPSKTLDSKSSNTVIVSALVCRSVTGNRLKIVYEWFLQQPNARATAESSSPATVCLLRRAMEFGTMERRVAGSTD